MRTKGVPSLSSLRSQCNGRLGRVGDCPRSAVGGLIHCLDELAAGEIAKHPIEHVPLCVPAEQAMKRRPIQAFGRGIP